MLGNINVKKKFKSNNTKGGKPKTDGALNAEQNSIGEIMLHIVHYRQTDLNMFFF